MNPMNAWRRPLALAGLLATLLVAATLAVFLFVTQQNFLSNVNTILVFAGGLIKMSVNRKIKWH